MKKTMRSLVFVATGALIGTGSAFAQNGPGATPAAKGEVTDPEIVAIVVAANKVDIDAGKVAKRKAKSPEVKQLSEEMIEEHTASNKEAMQLGKAQKIKPKENETSKSLKEKGKDNLAELNKLDGEAFDKAYTDQEVAFHQLVLTTIDETLLPNAQNEALKAMIVKTRPIIEGHLQHAKQVQASLAGNNGMGSGTGAATGAGTKPGTGIKPGAGTGAGQK